MDDPVPGDPDEVDVESPYAAVNDAIIAVREAKEALAALPQWTDYVVEGTLTSVAEEKKDELEAELEAMDEATDPNVKACKKKTLDSVLKGLHDVRISALKGTISIVVAETALLEVQTKILEVEMQNLDGIPFVNAIDEATSGLSAIQPQITIVNAEVEVARNAFNAVKAFTFTPAEAPAEGEEAVETAGECVEGTESLLVAPENEPSTDPENEGTIDSDNDGTVDISDNCPDTANADQLDTDSDNVGDECDNCKEVANEDQADADADGTGDACQQ